ncbi:hypothetical protein PUN28_012719 [Cardiocondyla obscurior]|uniref:Uncharacterized protein n=1 Tax=Cardiocondyla obscurior TaxID=286306 RepID=A0AAW2FIA8_9HYME
MICTIILIKTEHLLKNGSRRFALQSSRINVLIIFLNFHLLLQRIVIFCNFVYISVYNIYRFTCTCNCEYDRCITIASSTTIGLSRFILLINKIKYATFFSINKFLPFLFLKPLFFFCYNFFKGFSPLHVKKKKKKKKMPCLNTIFTHISGGAFIPVHTNRVHLRHYFSLSQRTFITVNIINLQHTINH